MPTKKTTSSETSNFIGKKLPAFALESSGGKTVSNKDVTSSDAVLYFYPKDSTSGCTQESIDFSELSSKFKKLGVVIYGVSRDSVKSHDKFKEKYSFPFDLLSDSDEKLCRALDVLKMKSMYGRQYLGIERSTFYIGKDGKIKNEWRNVKVPGHALDVYKFAKTLSESMD